jgi:SAM-dependent methyltransferase
MACVPGHPFMRKIITDVFSEKNFEQHNLPKHVYVLKTTGPWRLTELYEQSSAKERESIYLIPAEYVTPFDMVQARRVRMGEQSEELDKCLAEAYAVHYFFGTWMTVDKFDEKPTNQSIFTDIYKSNSWKSQESKSGTGSTFEATTIIRAKLPVIIEKYAIRSMLDAPCGDYNWMKTVEKSCSYTGVDIVAEAIENNQKLYASAKVQFKQMDITEDPLPTVDLIFCRDCLQHLSYMNVHKALVNFKSSGSKYLLVTSYPRTRINHDIEDGRYRALNLRKSPFFLPKPILKIKEFTSGEIDPHNEIDKTMYLYILSDLYQNSKK